MLLVYFHSQEFVSAVLCVQIIRCVMQTPVDHLLSVQGEAVPVSLGMKSLQTTCPHQILTAVLVSLINANWCEQV